MGLQSIFESCESIESLVKKLQDGQVFGDKETIQRRVMKLKIELLKNWLANHTDQYCEVLKLIARNENYLWKYSAKIFYKNFDLLK